MGWAAGIALILVSFIVIAIVAIAIDEMGAPDTDTVAERKRQTSKRARKMAGEFQERR